MLKFRLGINGLNEELRSHKGKKMIGSVRYVGINLRVW